MKDFINIVSVSGKSSIIPQYFDIHHWEISMLYINEIKVGIWAKKSRLIFSYAILKQIFSPHFPFPHSHLMSCHCGMARLLGHAYRSAAVCCHTLHHCFPRDMFHKWPRNVKDVHHYNDILNLSTLKDHTPRKKGN